MTRIAIIGNAGGGKSTLSRKLHEILGLPLHSIDQLQWRPGWQAVPKDEFDKAHADILTQPKWIIDGWGDFEAIDERFKHSDTIILIDYPLWRHYWWAAKRQFMCLFHSRADGPHGCPMIPMTWPLLKMIWFINRDAMPEIRSRVNAHNRLRRTVHIQTLNDLKSLYSEAELHEKTA